MPPAPWTSGPRRASTTVWETSWRGARPLSLPTDYPTISLADRVVLMEDGRIVADGTHAHLLATEPRYRAIVAQVEDREVGV